MSEMVERVARAMFEIGHADAHGPDIYEEQADWWRDVARAGIEAMREPVEAMAAAMVAIPVDDVKQRYLRQWRAGIDAALAS